MIDKPAGVTSHDVVARVRRIFRIKAVGHTGTLDPFATGLLVLLMGRATRLARFVEQRAKAYLATARLGFATTTDDATGAMLGGERSVAIDRDTIARTLSGMTGSQLQLPPAFSAKKVDGERSYRRARRGETVTLSASEVIIHRIELVSFDPPALVFRTTVSPGTYVRAIARDLGDMLGTGGHLTALRREAIGDLMVDAAVPLAMLTDATPLVPLRTVLGHMPSTEVTPEEQIAISHGRPIPRIPGDGPDVLLVQGTRILAVARQDGDWLRPAVVLEGP
ncbi:MAG: tRNA pseudouridine(55) synthase TruB [Gemmatimonadota bacterium]